MENNSITIPDVHYLSGQDCHMSDHHDTGKCPKRSKFLREEKNESTTPGAVKTDKQRMAGIGGKDARDATRTAPIVAILILPVKKPRLLKEAPENCRWKGMMTPVLPIIITDENRNQR